MSRVRFAPGQFCTAACTFIVACPLLAGAATARAGELYHNDEHHFKITLPDGWTAMPAGMFENYNARVAKTGVHYVVGFVTAGNPQKPPLLLIQVAPGNMGNLDYDDIKRDYAKEFKPELREIDGTTSELIEKTPIGHFMMCTDNMSPRRDCVVWHMQPDTKLGKMDIVGCGHIGSEAIVTLWGYEFANEFPTFAPVLGQINDSFEFDSHRYMFPNAVVPRSLLRMIDVFGYGGGALAIAIGSYLGFRAIKAKPKPKRNRPNFDDLDFGGGK